MEGVPEGWGWAELGEIASSVKNGMYVSRPGAEPNGTPILRIGAVRSMRLSLDDLRYTGLDWREVLDQAGDAVPGDLLFTRYNGNPEYVGAGARVPEGAPHLAYPDKLIRVRVPPDVLDSRFLVYAWASPQVREQVRGQVKTSAGQAGISGASLKRIKVPVPPLAEQRRIVETLEEQLSRLDAAERVLRVNHARIRALAARVTNFATARAVPADQPTAPLPREADAIDRNLPRIPSSWSWERLGDIAEVVGGVTKDKKKQFDPDLTEVPYLRVANVQRGWLDLSRVATIRVPDKKAEDLRLETGDVLMNEGGDRDKLGRGWVWRGEVKDAIHQNHVFRARVHGEIILPELLAYHANSSARWFEANGKQTTNLASISLKKIRNLPVPIPPAGEQPDILQQSGEQLDGLARVEAAVEVGLKRAATLRSALLRKALTGNLISQDPADEPAAPLLARIAAEREAAKPVRKAAKRAARPRKATAAAAVTKAAPAPTPAPSASVQQELFDR
ncbi:restriction endonuclease subunit S [Streptomyces sp. NPDC000151]|uniref:restriction endonuclease subunit S n=1 Tax=Streptomyces sp. NPDC000151 TaxID=3154244 RepID=UPI0033240815